MDPLSDVLSLLQPRTQYCAGFDAAGNWAFSFPPHEGIKFAVVTLGSCWGRTDELKDPLQFSEGDCFLLNSGAQIVLSSDPTLPVESGDHFLDAVNKGEVAVHGGGGEVFLVCGSFAFSGNHAKVLLDALPSIMNIPKASAHADVLRWSLEQLSSELKSPQPGSWLMSAHLAQLMLLQVLRVFLSTANDLPKGWFLALTDKQVSPAIAAMHAQPAKRWTLEELARVSGVSRTVLAQRFKAVVGSTVMGYLARWRMLIAADRLRTGAESVASIAFSLGYESESSFCTAFKRIMSHSPAQYRRQSLT